MSFIKILPFLLIILLSVVLFTVGNPKNNEKYQIWFRPWFSFFFVLLLLYVYSLLFNWLTTYFSTTTRFYIEAYFCVAVLVLWLPLKFLFKNQSFHDLFIEVYRKIVKKGDALPYPYYFDNENVKSREGKNFFKFFFIILSLIIILLYGVIFWYKDKIGEFVNTCIPLLILPFIIDFYVYFNSDASYDTATIIDEPEEKQADFMKLWRLYVDTFVTGISIAWYKDRQKGDDNNINIENDKVLQVLTREFQDKKKDLIISDMDLAGSFYKLAPILMHAVNTGGNILVAVDIPPHFLPSLSADQCNSTDRSDNYMQSFAQELTMLLYKKIPGVREVLNINLFNASRASDIFKSRVILTSVNDLLNNKIDDKNWLSDLKLLTIINMFDRGISNLFESRRFNFFLKEKAPDYQTLIITPYRANLQDALKNTWSLNDFVERKLLRAAGADKKYFIGFDFEKWKNNWDIIASANPPHDIYSGLGISSVAISENVNEVNFIELAYSQVVEGLEELQNYASYIKKFPINSSDVNEKIKLNIFPIVDLPDDKTFSIIYDTENNAPKVYQNWQHLGRNENFSVIISKPHLFREYFNYCFSFFVKHPANALQPVLSNCKINLALLILCILQKGNVYKEKLTETIASFGLYEEKDVVEVIAELFKKYFNYDVYENFNLNVGRETVFENSEYMNKVYYHFNNPNLVLENQGFGFLKVVKVKEKTSGCVLFNIIKDLVFQNYLPGQVHSFNGRAYKIFDFNDNTLIVENTKSSNTLFYKSILNVTLDDIKHHHLIELIKRERENNRIIFELYEAPFNIISRGYYSFQKDYHGSAVSSYTNMTNFDRGDSEKYSRKYANGRFLKIKWKTADAYVERKNEIKKSLQLLLYESLYFFFPQHAHYLIVTADMSLDDTLPWMFPCFINENKEYDKDLVLYIFEDANIDLGLLRSITDNFSYIIQYIFDYLLWLSEDDASSGAAFDLYFLRKDYDKSAFLKYGANELPQFLDIALVIDFLNNNWPYPNVFYDIQKKRHLEHQPINGECDFCRGIFKISEMSVLLDGRMRCKECSNGAIDSEAQFMPIYEQAKKLYLDELKINFGLIPHDHYFLSAKELHDRGGYPFSITELYDTREAIGLAFNTDNDYFLVEDGYKFMQTLQVTIHELAHIWQYYQPNYDVAKKRHEEMIEGMAVWAECFLLEKAGFKQEADNHRQYSLNLDNKYGKGIRFVMEHCPDNPFDYFLKIT